MWSTKYLSEYWKFASYVALLDDNRWVKRILHWNPGGGRSDVMMLCFTNSQEIVILSASQRRSLPVVGTTVSTAHIYCLNLFLPKEPGRPGWLSPVYGDCLSIMPLARLAQGFNKSFFFFGVARRDTI